MVDPEQEMWWRTTRALAVATLGGALLFGFLLVVLVRVTETDSVLGLPADYALAAVAMPLVLLVAVFWFARRQGDVDRQHHLGEE